MYARSDMDDHGFPGCYLPSDADGCAWLCVGAPVLVCLPALIVFQRKAAAILGPLVIKDCGMRFSGTS